MADLFDPIRINTMELPHRFITGPMERGLANRDGTITTRYVEYLSARAQGGAGLIQVESTFVDPRGRGHLFQVGCHVDEVVEPLSRAASAVHAYGAKIALELYLGGRETPSVMSQRQPIAPSQVRCEVLSPVPTPRSMTHSDMEDVVDSFVLATQRAVRAGIDMIHLHGAHGYLIGSFLSPFSNRREDEFGGSLVNRARFPLMIIRAVRAALGPSAPLGYRLSADEFVPNGLRLEESKEFATMLADAGIDLIDVSGGIYESAHTIIQGAGSAATPFVSLAKAIKDEVGEDAVVSVAQRLSEPGVAEQVLAQGIDMVSLTRAFHADPEYVNKVRGGRPDQVIPCVACHHCTDMLEANLPVDCSVNPRSTREYLAEPTMGPRKLRVAVIGGGPAGLRAAIGLAEVGHRVVLIHREEQLGGQLLRASMVGDFHRYVGYATSKVDNLGIEVRLGTEADAALIDQLAPDAVIVATGAKGAPPAYDIRDRVEPSDLFSAPLSNPQAWNGKALIVGGDGTGCAAAIQLAHPRLEVIIVEPDDALAKDRRAPGRAHLLRLVEAEPNIEVHLETTVEAVGNGYAEIQSRGIASRLHEISHVVTGGRQSENGLAEQLAASRHPKVLTIGDAARPRDLHSATLEGMKAAALISAEAAAVALS